MVGDGLNDGPALKGADVAMAPAGASDVGQMAADLVFFGESLSAVPRAVMAARQTMKIIKQNFNGVAAEFTSFLKKQGLTEADVTRILRAGIEEPKVTARVTKGVTFTPAQALKTVWRAVWPLGLGIGLAAGRL